MKKYLILTIILCLLASSVIACFGPKLYLGVAPGPQGELQFALLSLYIKEKTGTEVERIVVEHDPRTAIADGQVDFAFVSPRAGEEFLLALSADSVLLGGKRITADLQFTTTVPALSKLRQLLNEKHYRQLLEQVRQGAAPLALVRQFYFEQGWL